MKYIKAIGLIVLGLGISTLDSVVIAFKNWGKILEGENNPLIVSTIINSQTNLLLVLIFLVLLYIAMRKDD